MLEESVTAVTGRPRSGRRTIRCSPRIHLHRWPGSSLPAGGQRTLGTARKKMVAASHEVSNQCAFQKRGHPVGSEAVFSEAYTRAAEGSYFSSLWALRATVLRRAISQWRGSTLRAQLCCSSTKPGGVCWRPAKQPHRSLRGRHRSSPVSVSQRTSMHCCFSKECCAAFPPAP